ncbi:MAG: hypothetical protein ACTHM1_04740 [Solirubrobacteraceae bacterium]
MSRKPSKGKRSSPTPSARTVARAMLGTAILYNKLVRARAVAGAKTGMVASRRGGKACRCKGRCPCHRGKASPVRTLGAMSVGATALGALAVGALAIGALAIRRLAIKRGDVERLDIRELKVKRFEVDELLVREETRSQPPTAAGGPPAPHGGPGAPPGGGPGSEPGPMPA